LFSLSGIVPLGAFVVLHLADMARALAGPAAFESGLARLTPLRLWLEAAIIGVPLAFHAVVGIALLRGPRFNITRYPYSGNWSYTLGRASAPIALVFIGYHVWETRGRVLLGQVASADFHDALASTLSATGALGVPWLALAYLLGVAAVVLHLSIGVVGFAASFGLVRTLVATRRLAWVCALFGSLLFLLGAATVLSLATGAAPGMGGGS
jgi:succinate dehydrogenase / fumarate reductase cytochrome b subunit